MFQVTLQLGSKRQSLLTGRFPAGVPHLIYAPAFLSPSVTEEIVIAKNRYAQAGGVPLCVGCWLLLFLTPGVCLGVLEQTSARLIN